MANPKHIVWAGALLALAIVLAWSNSLDGPFVLDDLLNISNNETIRDVGNLRVFAPPLDTGAGGRPLLNFTFALNYALSGNAVRGYHVGNLAIHVAAALALLGLVRRTLLTAPLRARFGAVALPLATATALLWALHPLQTASVTYISQRAESLMGLCYFLVLYCVARGWHIGAVVAFVCGVGTKEVIATAPLLALLYDRTFLAGSFREAWRQRRGLYLGLLTAYGLLAWLMIGIKARGIAAGESDTPLSYLLVECRVLISYLKLAVWPHPLVFDYGEFAPALGKSLACAFLLGPLLIGLAFALVRRPVLGFVGAWFFVVLAPTSSVVPVSFQPMAENRVYVPLAALAVALVIGVHALWPRRSLLVVGAIAAACLALTVQRNHDYRDPLVLWTKNLAERPDNFRAQNEYALTLGLAGRTGEAIASLERALVRRPESSLLHRNLALLLMQEGKVEAALAHFATVVRLQPEFIKGRQEYARALATANRLPDAIEQVQAALKLLPKAPGAQAELASLLLRAGRTSEAIAAFETALRLDPDNASTRHNFGLALTSAQRPADALPQFEAAVRLKPDAAESHFALANTLAGLGRLPEAMPHYEATLRLDPNYPQARQFYEMARERLAP